MLLSDYIGLFGYLGLSSAFIVCASLVLISLILFFFPNPSLERFSKELTHAQSILLAVAVISLGILFQVDAYEFETVFNSVEISMSSFERIGGLWSSQAASLLFWSFILSAAASLSLLIAKQIRSVNHAPTVLFILELTLVFFILPDVFFSNPFQKTWILPTGDIIAAVFPPQGASILVPMDGQGMNPSLRHIAMFFHPPTLYLGLIGFFIPYAFGLSSLVNDDRELTWMRLVFPVALAAWVFLTIGMLLGSWWAYSILGWGGYWGWDAVEISGLLPWLLSFGLIHSFNIQLRGQPYRRWLYPLSFAIVILTLFGILITRSGILESVHAYTSGAMGPMLTALVIMHLSAAIVLIIKRRALLAEKSTHQSSSFLDNLTHLFNICLVGLVSIYLFGQTFPLTSQLFLAKDLSFSPQDYESVSSPVLFTVIILTAIFPLAADHDVNLGRFKRSLIGLITISAICPVLILLRYSISFFALIGFWAAAFLLCSWLYALIRDGLLPMVHKKNNQTMPSKRIRLGTLIIHLGFAVMALGILGVENLSASHDIQLDFGGEETISGYTITNLAQDNHVNGGEITRFENRINLTNPNGSSYEFNPLNEYFPKSGSLHAQPAISVGFLQDVQLVLSKVPDHQQDGVDLHIAFFPLMSWIWVGGALMAIGGLLSLLKLTHPH